MNCFEWQNQCSDFLDAGLPDSLKREADDHLESCKDCSEKYKHFRIILSSIASQPRSSLPLQIRRAPLSAALPRIEPSKLSFSTWDQIPWSVRTILEASGIIFGVFLMISITPKIRALYEKSFEKSLSDFKESLTTSEASLDLNEHHLSDLPETETSVPLEKVTAGPNPDELSGEDDSDPSKNLHVGRSELWRFNVKTVTPDELRPQVVKVLTTLGVPEKTPGLGGMQVPGGIEFDLLLPQNLVAKVKYALENLAPHSIENKNEGPGSENFTWFRVKSKRKVPEGKSQVVIWLAQPH